MVRDHLEDENFGWKIILKWALKNNEFQKTFSHIIQTVIET
jgi:hypothetical protein